MSTESLVNKEAFAPEEPEDSDPFEGEGVVGVPEQKTRPLQPCSAISLSSRMMVSAVCHSSANTTTESPRSNGGSQHL